MTDTKKNETMREMSLDELNAVHAGTTMPTAKKSTAKKAQGLGQKLITWYAQKLSDLGL